MTMQAGRVGPRPLQPSVHIPVPSPGHMGVVSQLFITTYRCPPRPLRSSTHDHGPAKHDTLSSSSIVYPCLCGYPESIVWSQHMPQQPPSQKGTHVAQTSVFAGLSLPDPSPSLLGPSHHPPGETHPKPSARHAANTPENILLQNHLLVIALVVLC